MPVTVFHALTATTPDDTNFEIRPIAHWNALHVASMSATAGTEVIGAFSNTNGVSFGLSNGLITVSAVGGQPVFSAGTSSNNLTQVVFSNSNGMSFGLNGSTITGSFSAPNYSAGTTSSNIASLVFSNANGVSFGLSGSTITASVPGGGGSTLTLVAKGNTTGASSSSTMPFSAFSISGTGAISVGLSAGNFLISAPGTVALTQFSGGMSTAGNTAGTTGLATAQMVLVGNSPLSLSQSLNLGSATVTFRVPATSSIVGTNGLSVSTTGSTISLIPITSAITGASGLTVSSAGSTMSVGQIPLSRKIWPQGNLTAISAPVQGGVSIQYVPLDSPLSASRLDGLFQWSGASSAASNTGAVVISAWGAIYTRGGSTLNSLSSGSTQTTYTYASNSAGATYLTNSLAFRPVSVPINMSFTQGEYFVAFNMSTNSSSIGANTTNLAQTISVMGGNALQTALNYAEFGSQSAATRGLYGGMGVHSLTSAGLPASMALSDISQTGASLSQANIALVFRNV